MQEAVTTDGGDPSPFELCTPAESGGPDEDLQQDRATEFSQYPLFSSQRPLGKCQKRN